MQLFVRQPRAERLARGKELSKVDPGIEAFRLQQVDEIFGSGVADRARCIGTAAKAAQRRVEATHILLECRYNVGECQTERVVQMQIAESFDADF